MKQSHTPGVLWLLITLLLSSCEGERLGRQVSTEPTEPPTTLVSPDEAKSIAQDFASDIAGGPLRSLAHPKLLGANTDLSGLRGEDPYPAYYLFSLSDGGYVIVSADRTTTSEILGYATEGDLDPTSIPCGLRWLLQSYSEEIRLARQLDLPARALRAEEPKGKIVVKPLTDGIEWNQSPYYNALCPPGTPVGCVATATSQIMRYWEYPERGTGSHSYITYVGGQRVRLEADYDHPLDWEAMPKAVLEKPNADIARFCYEVAVGVHMSFDPVGSGAFSYDVPPLLINHYGYSRTTHYMDRGMTPLADWEAMIRRDLDAGRPVYYSGSGSGGGHAFVADGYDTTHYFHINWGWGGMSNGWFLLDALDPNDLGTGGGAGDFNYYQGAIFGIKPIETVAGNNDKDEFPGEHEDEAVDPLQYPSSWVEKPEALSIAEVKVGDRTNASGTSDYSDYTQLYLPVNVGKVPVTITIAHLYLTLKGNITVWVDLNSDGWLDDDERLLMAPEKDGIVDGTITLPTDLEPGSYRMRITLSTWDDPYPDEKLLYGEVEDYTLTVTR